MRTFSLAAHALSISGAFCLLVLFQHVARADANANQARSLLRANGISADSAGVVAYLRRQFSTAADVQSKIAKLIRQLGDSSFVQREAASAKLGSFGVTSRVQL